MRRTTIVDKEHQVAMVMEYDKSFTNQDYRILFNSKTGQEAMYGVGGKPDPTVLELPSMIDIGIMGKCKNKCKICYQGDDEEDNITLETFKTIIDQSSHHAMQCALGGRGDPNLHENFREILEYSRENGVIPNYTTSGNGLTDEQVEISKLCGAVAVSNYGQDFTFEALRKFMDAGIKTNIHFIITRESIHDAITAIQGYDIWSEKVDIKKLNAVVFLLFKPQGRGKEFKDLAPTDHQIQLFSGVIREPKCDFKVGLDSCLFNKIKRARELTSIEKVYADTCEAGRMSCYITPRGVVIPCSFMTHDGNGASVHESTLWEIWNTHTFFQVAREKLKEDHTCCPYEL